MIRTSDEVARDSLYGQRWMQFSAWDSGIVTFWLDDDGEVAAYLRWSDDDPEGISFFEVRDTGCGIGGTIIRQLQAEMPGIFIAGDIDNAACARFWARMGFDVDVAVIAE